MEESSPSGDAETSAAVPAQAITHDAKSIASLSSQEHAGTPATVLPILHISHVGAATSLPCAPCAGTHKKDTTTIVVTKRIFEGETTTALSQLICGSQASGKMLKKSFHVIAVPQAPA